MSEQLKPCPFCGGKAFIVMGCNGKEIFYIRCHDCEATGEKFNNNDPRGQAILAWNNRRGENIRIDGTHEGIKHVIKIIEHCEKSFQALGLSESPELKALKTSLGIVVYKNWPRKD